MISKADIKRIRTLQQKKFRQSESAFLVEGEKMVCEALSATAPFSVQEICCLEAQADYFQENATVAVHTVSEKEMEQLSSFASPSPVLAVLSYSPLPEIPVAKHGKLYLALDGVRDPGNLGTIIRLADWFAIEGIFASEDCVELLNPKTVQSTMGALFRVPFCYTSLEKLLPESPVPCYGTVLEGGTDINQMELGTEGIIVMGSESHGIRPELLPHLQHRLFIPSYRPGTESLNVAIATAVTCARFRQNGTSLSMPTE